MELFEQHGARKRSTDFSQGEQLAACEINLIAFEPGRSRTTWVG